MHTLLLVITLSAMALVVHHHLIWPFLLARAARRALPVPAPVPDATLPAIHVVMPAHNEARFIAAKIENLAALDYPRDRLAVSILLDGCSDGTEHLAREALARTGLQARLVVHTRNRGKLNVLQEAVAGLSEPIIALTDVSAMLPPEALRRAAAYFTQARLGAVGGGYALDAASPGETAYWRHQVSVKRGEAALGAPLGLHGAFWAFRREAFIAVPPDTINDDFVLPCLMIRDGWRVAYAPEIAVREAECSTVRQDLRRRRRIARGNMQQLLRLWPLLHPRHGAIALAFLSGKALRVVMPLLLLVSGLGTVALAASSPVFAVLALAGGAGLLAALLGLWLGERAPRALRVAAYALAGHAVGLLGAVEQLFTRRAGPWSRA